MIKEIKIITEYHKNGALFYKEKRAIIEPLFIDAYSNLTNFRFLEDIAFIKIESEKHFDNGQFAWRLEWNEKGELINKKDLQFRKDGTNINY